MADKERILVLLGRVTRPGMDGLINYLETSDYFTAPGSSLHHDTVKGGLATHCLKVYGNLVYLNDKFGTLNNDSVILCALLHDLCKVNLYKDNILKSGKQSTDKPYTSEDLLPLGHGEKSLYLIQKYIQLTDEEALCIRWHMGLYDKSLFANDSKLQELCPNAYLLYFADHLSVLFPDDKGGSSLDLPEEKVSFIHLTSPKDI